MQGILVCNFLLWRWICNKSAGGTGQKHHRKVLQRHSTWEAEKHQKWRPVTGFKHIRLPHGNVPAHASEIVTLFLKKESNCFASPPVFPRSCPMWFLYVSEIEIIPCWAEIPVLTGTWICYSSVPYYCAQISVPWRLQEVLTSAKALFF